MTHKVRAFAKVNLHLEVLNKRSDSYHNIFSLNASLDLSDRLTFKRLNISNKFKDIQIDIDPDGGRWEDVLSSVPVKDNLITRAVKLYLRRIDKSGEIIIAVEKNIPAGAGMGGGSSDAAAALRLLNNYFMMSNEGLPEQELVSLGAEIGADVPYCLHGGFALCEGIGEIVEHVEGGLEHWVLSANCGVKINTGEAYKALQRSGESALYESRILEKKAVFKEGIGKGDLNFFKHVLKNDFEPPVFSNHPELNDLKRIIAGYGPEYVTMTGSGSTIIGLFKSKNDAEKAGEGLSGKAEVIITKFL